VLFELTYWYFGVASFEGTCDCVGAIIDLLLQQEVDLYVIFGKVGSTVWTLGRLVII